MKTWSFYDPGTGLFDGCSYSCDHDEFLEDNARGRGSIEGRFDSLRQRVELKTGDVVDYQPPPPDDDHEWNAETRTWQLKAEIAEAREAQAAAMAEIDRLERGQLRTLRELALGKPGALERLQAIDDQVTAVAIESGVRES